MILRRFLPSLRTITVKQNKLKKLKQYRNQTYSDQSFDKSQVLQLFQLSQLKKEKKEIVTYPVAEAFTLLQNTPQRTPQFNEQKKGRDVVHVMIKLNCDPQRSDQGVRGSCLMPAGLGKDIKVAVFTSEEMKQTALEAGADIIGDETLIKQILSGDPLPFQKCLATQDVIHDLRPVARALGQKGLMPNKKVGTLVTEQNLAQTIKGFKAGSVEFRLDKFSKIYSKLGLLEFQHQQLLVNFDALIRKLWQLRPEAVKGKGWRLLGRYLSDVKIKATFSESYRVQLEGLDPSKPENYFFA